MQAIIERYRPLIIQIATPHSMGTGFYLQQQGLIVTNEHVVRDYAEVVIQNQVVKRQLARVMCMDSLHDLALLVPHQPLLLPEATLGNGSLPTEGDTVLALGRPFASKFTATQGIVSDTRREYHDLMYIQHDAALNPGNSGGPLLNTQGEIIGINAFDLQEGNKIGFALPVRYLLKTLEDFAAGQGKIAARCFSCGNLSFEGQNEDDSCPHCGAHLLMPNQVDAFEQEGVPYTIEQLLVALGHTPTLARLGPNTWQIEQGSARIQISYHEETGLVTGDAHLCTLPTSMLPELYEYLLTQNYLEECLSFSIKGRDIVLSLLIYDRYLNVDTGRRLFQNLFERADYYDNVLVERFAASWKYQEEEE